MVLYPCESFGLQLRLKKTLSRCNPGVLSSEESYFFKTDKYVEELLKKCEEPQTSLRLNRVKEMVNTFIKPD